MRCSTLVAAILVAAIPAFAARTRCAAMVPNAHLVSTQKSLLVKADPPTNHTLKYYVHVVTTAAKKGKYPQSMVDLQVRVMKRTFAHYGISLVYQSTSYTVNDTWATTTYNTPAEIAMKTALRLGGYGDLNHYYMSDIAGNDESGLLGQCYFPVTGGASDPATLTKDGCILGAETMPGGEAVPFDKGITAVHETGHWFGLFHPFQGENCNGNNDLVYDTAFQATPSYGCQVGKNSCPNSPGNDSIHSYMDYSDDTCNFGFTEGQHRRLQNLYGRYRA